MLWRESGMACDTSRTLKCTFISNLYKMRFKFCLPSWIVFAVINFSNLPSTGAKNCEGFGDCVIFSGYTCKNNKCVCDPDEPGFFRCIPPKFYGERCNSDQECQLGDYNLHCLKSDIRICKCKRFAARSGSFLFVLVCLTYPDNKLKQKIMSYVNILQVGVTAGSLEIWLPPTLLVVWGYVWDMERKKCLPTIDDDMYNGKFEPVRDLIIPGLIIMTIGAMVYLGFKLFCNCGKLWRRRRHQEIARELEEISAAPHQQAWIASYRVFSPYNNSNRPTSALSPASFPLHPAPCMGLFVPSQSLSQSPPPYEEALKHKVILSSYPHTGPPVVPVPAYTLPATDIPRQYQTLPPNSSGSSSIILNPNGSGSSSLKYSGHRSFSATQNEGFGAVPLTNEWTQIQYTVSGTTSQIRNPHHPVNTQETPTPADGADAGSQQSRVPQVEVWTPRNSQMLITQPRGGVFRPGQLQKIYHGSDSPRNLQSNDRNT